MVKKSKCVVKMMFERSTFNLLTIGLKTIYCLLFTYAFTFLAFNLAYRVILGKEIRPLVKWLTQVDVGVESHSAVLYIEGKSVDIEVTGTDHSDWWGIVHPTIAVQVHIRHKGSCVFIHTARQEQEQSSYESNVCKTRALHLIFLNLNGCALVPKTHEKTTF